MKNITKEQFNAIIFCMAQRLYRKVNKKNLSSIFRR